MEMWNDGNISIKGVRKVFPQPDGSEVVALNDINFDFTSGEFISLIGPSGCGKSTLLRIIAGLTQPDSGDLELDGEKITAPGYERGLVFQDPTLFPWKTVYENIAYGLRARKVYREEKDSIPEFIKLVGLEGFEKSYPHQLSGGMAQRPVLPAPL